MKQRLDYEIKNRKEVIILPPPLGNVHKLQHVMQRFQVITS